MDTFESLQVKLNANLIKLNWCLLTIVFLLILSMLISFYSNKNHLEKQHRQIDELCQMMVTLVNCQEITKEQFGLTYRKEYGFYFGDYNRGIAVLEELDPSTPGYVTRDPRWIILRGIDEKTLDDWSRAPLHYNKYMKIE